MIASLFFLSMYLHCLFLFIQIQNLTKTYFNLEFISFTLSEPFSNTVTSLTYFEISSTLLWATIACMGLLHLHKYYYPTKLVIIENIRDVD